MFADFSFGGYKILIDILMDIDSENRKSDLRKLHFDTDTAEMTELINANKRPESDWVVLPVTNMSVYFHSTEFSKKWLPKIPEEFLERKKTSFGVCAIRVKF